MRPVLQSGQLLAIFLLTSCASHLATVSPENIDLSGTWALNKQLSDAVILPPSRLSSGQASSGNSRNVRSGRRPLGSNRRTDVNRSSEDGSGGREVLMSPAVIKATEMTIEQNADSMGVTYPNERYRDVDWGQNEIGSIKITAGWDNDQLVIKSDAKHIDFTEVYRLDSDGEVLALTLKIKSSRGSKEFLRVFNRKPEGE